ncbi:MAG: HYR domain-containing protein, partial [Phaeodactylibacter sp.]|nr:HYR domain-containing protein [Phaeodactylibacter sp.]
MKQLLPSIMHQANFSLTGKAMRVLPFLLWFGGFSLFGQTPVITARFANPQYDCNAGEYCVDVEFQSDTPGEELFGLNLRFFYDESILTLIDTRDFQGGYTGSNGTNPYVPASNTLAPGAGPVLFNFSGNATFVNGAVSKTNSGATPIPISTTGWTKLFQACFSVDNPAALNNFCPSLVWDLEFNPSNGGFPAGDDGVVITLVDPNPLFDSKPSTENVVQYNWAYNDPNTTTVPPFGVLVEDICISPNCGGSPEIDLAVDISVNDATPLVGDPVVFTATLNNAPGFDQANNITVSVPLPAGFTWSGDDSGGAYNPGTGDWAIPSLASNTTTVLTITATVNATGPYLTLAEVTAADESDVDSTPGDGVDTDMDMNVEDDPDDDDDGDGVLVTPIQPNPNIELEKTGAWNDDGDGFAEVGETITYAFTVYNTGNVTLTNITVSDVTPGVTVSGGPLANLAPGASDNSTFTASYTLTQADIDAGIFSNQATASGDDPNGNPVDDNASDDPTTPAPNDPTDITLPSAPTPVPVVTVRLANPTYDCGNQTYCLDVEYLSDTPGQELFGSNVRFFYDDDELEFTAFTDFQGGYGEVAPTPPGVTTFPAAQGPAAFGFAGAPEWVNGAIQLTNPGGAITLSTTNWTKVFQICFDVVDPNANLNNFCPPVVWDLEENVFDGGFITGDDGVVITLVNPDPLEDSSPTVENVQHNNWQYDGQSGLPFGAPVEEACIVIRCIDLSIDKLVDETAPLIGSDVVFTLTLNNAGPDDALDVMVNDLLPGGFTYSSDNSGGKYDAVSGDWDVGVLAAGATTSIEITATVNAAGDYINLAEVTAATGVDIDSEPNNGVDTDGDMNVEDDPDDEDDGDGVVVAPVAGGLIVIKDDMIDPGANLILNVGDVINYTITVENNSFEFISNITISDPMVDPGSISCTLSEPFSLAPGETTSCTATHTITQADLDAEMVVNVATANGEYPNGDPVSDPSDDPDDPTDDDPDMDGEPDDPTVSNLEQGPVVTVRLVNPTYDCGSETYCLDVEYISDTPGQELFGSNVRFFYDDSELQFVGFSDFQGGYGPVAPNPANIITYAPNLGPNAFTFTGAPEWVNGAIQLTNTNATPIILSTTNWTKIFQICFDVTDPNANLNNFCPPVVWDLEENVYDGGFVVGDDGVVITLVNPDPLEDSSPSIEQVQHHNWQYDGMAGLPYGQTIESACTVIRCIDLSLDKLIDNSTPAIGSQVVFTIRVDNAGPDEAQDVVVTDQLPAGFTYYSDNAAGDYDPNTGEWTIGSMPAGSTEVMQITATVNQNGPYINLAEVTNATGIDPDSEPNNGVDTDGDMMVINDPGDEDDGDGAGVTPLETADLSLIKGVSVSPAATAGSTATFTVVVSNDGPSNATGVDVEDVVPNGYSAITNISGGGMLNGNTITWSGLSIPVGGSLTFTFDATIEASGDYMNLAEITASDLPDVDSTPGNGVDTDGDGQEDDDPDDEDDGDGASIDLIFLICPNDIIVNNDPDKCGANVNWAPPSSSDNVGTTVVQTGGPAPGSFFPVGGPTTITYTAYDAAGNPVATCTFTITVVDMQLPMIECPVSFITLGTNGGDCFYTAQGLDPAAKDNCGLSSLTHDYVGAPSNTTLDGAEFPVGTHTVTWTATDGNNNAASCTIQITVVDDDAPVVEDCPADITDTNDAGQCGAVVTYDAPVFSDNCGGASLPGTLVAGLPSGAFFPAGGTTVTYEYTDAAGQTAQCSFEVTIIDTQIPEITCPNNIVVGADGMITSGAATVVSFGPCGVTLSYTPPVGTDNCPGAETDLTGGQGGAPNAYEYGGYYTETYTVEDAAGNQASCSFTITVEDPVQPQITCPQDITVSTDPGTCDAIVTYTNPLGGDNCPGFSISLTQGLPSGSAFPLGATTVEFTITDDMGNAVSCTFDVTVEDGGAPTIDVCPVDQTVATSSDGTGDCQAEVPNLTGQLQASDACSATANLTVSQSPSAGTLFGGAHGDEQVVILTVTDEAGNSTTCEVTLTLVDDEAPSIDCSQIVTDRNAAPGQCSFTMPGNGFDPTYSDNCSAALSHNYAPAPSAHTLAGATFPLGTTSVTWTVQDENGQTASCTIDITITDDEDPVAMCVPGLTVVLDGSGSFQIPVSFIDLGSWDNCGPLASKLISLDGVNFGSEAAVDCDDTGAPVTVTLQVEDQSGNTSTCTVAVTVLDNESPDISCPGNIYTSTDAGVCAATVNGLAPIGQDNCNYTIDYSLSGATTGSGGDDVSGASFNTGTTTVTYTITDGSSNSASCSFLVIVSDNEAPVAAQCPAGPLTFNSDANACGTAVNYLSPLFDDNCDGAGLSGTLLAGQASGSFFPVGTTTITYEYTDAAGNSSQCSFDVIVDDNIDPEFTNCPLDIVVEVQNGAATVVSGAANVIGLGPCGVTMSYDPLTATDNCSGWVVSQLLGNNANPQFYAYDLVYTQIYRVTDASGNFMDCEFTVTVQDLDGASFVCPSDMTVTADPGACEAVVNYAFPFSATNCPGYTVTQVSGPNSGAAFPLGSTTVTFIIEDDMGNQTTCSFDVTVVDGEAPEILACAADQDVQTSSDGSGNCTAEVPALSVTASDNCTASGSLTITQSPAAGTLFGGAHGDEQIVTITVTDAAGNSSTCEVV